jgi:hypothetical protein
LSPLQEKVAELEKLLGHPLSPEQKEKVGGLQPTSPKAKYLDLKQDASGKWWGLNAETQKMEMVPGQEGFKPAPKISAMGKVDPIITAQIGKPPDPTVYPKGEDDPIYKAKAKLWGVEAETIKTRMASAAAEARGKAYGTYRPGAYITPEGELVSSFAGPAIEKGYVPAPQGFQAMSKQAQFQEMSNASGNLRHAIEALQPGDAFSPDQVAKLNLAARAPDEGVFTAIVSNLASSTTNERQQDYLIWLQQMGERILSLRNVAGMGQGAQDLRAAIQATLPNISSGTKEFALKRLDAVDNQITLLQRGIPKVSGINTATPSNVIVVKPEDLK